MARTSTKKRNGATANPQDDLARGIAAVERGDREEAYRIFQQTAELNPNNPDAWVWAGGTAGSLDDAEAAFERAYSLDPNNDQASLGLRWVRLRRNAVEPPVVGEAVPVPTWSQQTYAPEVAPVAAPAVAIPTTLTCPNCAKENDLAQKFCVDCGQDLQAVRAQYAGMGGIETEPARRRGIPTPAVVAIIIVVLAILAAGLYWYFTSFR